VRGGGATHQPSGLIPTTLQWVITKSINLKHQDSQAIKASLYLNNYLSCDKSEFEFKNLKCNSMSDQILQRH
jgi:hypothetical protein